MKKILYLTYRYPFKNGPHCSFGQNVFYEVLKTQYEVRGICFENIDLNDNNFIFIKRESNILKKAVKLIFGIPIRQTHYYSKEYKNLVQNELTIFSPDIIFVEHTVMMQYVRQKIPGVKIFFFDDESMIFAESNKLLKSIKEKLKNIFMSVKEKESIIRSDVVFTITNQEKNFLSKEGYKNVEFLPYGIDSKYYYYNWQPYSEKNNWQPSSKKIKVLFLGNFNHYPNKEAVKFIYRFILPSFSDKQIEFVIVGLNTNEIKKRIREKFLVYENVPDVREFYWNSTIFIAPLFCGGGLRTKILEAASCGIPLLISPLANNGFNFEHKREVLIANSPSEFLSMLNYIKSLKSLEYLNRLSNNANKKVSTEFSKEIIQNKFYNYIQKYS